MILHGRDGESYRVHFFYTRIEHDLFGPRRLVGCHLHIGGCVRVDDGPCQAEGGEGTTIFNPNDMEYTKVKGRSYALARAMKSFGLSRVQRTPLWTEYVQTVGLFAKEE